MTDGYFKQPKNTMPQINEIWAFVSVDPEDGNEGVIGYSPHPGMLVPMIAADEKRLACLRVEAEAIAQETGIKIKLVKFSTREVLEEFGRIN